MSSSLILWLVIGGIALAVDIVTSAFLFVWFTVGAIAAITAQIFGASFMVQIIIFIIVSVIFTGVGYPMAKKTIKSSVKPTPTREETYIGKQITVDDDVIEKGSVKIDGVHWNIIIEGEPIQEGDKVKVIGVQGNKIIIEKI